MEKKKLSVKALMSLILSAILFCMPMGAFFANRANTVEVHAEDTAERQTESTENTGNTESTGNIGNTVTPGNGKEETAGAGKTEGSTEGATEGTTGETKPAKCTCTEKCSQYEVDKGCAVCSKDYKDCAHVNPSVKITIATPTGWHNDTTTVHISVEDTRKSGNFTIQKVQAKVAQNGSWTDITEDMDDGHAGVHQSKGGTADGCLRGGAVGGQDLRHAADGVRELSLVRQHGDQGTLCQVAVADLAAAGAAGSAGLADRIRREVVVMDVTLVLGVRQVVHQLGVLGRAQGADGQDLGLAAGEHAGTMYAGLPESVQTYSTSGEG